ncbi:hypothetical protein EDB81DRAFT_50117 [Dactylonectria macrodidyma]|uniref:Uncharacterized protein n=1 Tax=Dactylonectria macrodidyma TaxID=307937 RepID=A0A9P9FWG5_9HYPO|nr:hypothetical protein EDB81DRAFT_50117 [Dactylonectria macrodidyma]
MQKFKWMLITLIAPEALLVKAVTDYRSVKHHSQMLRKVADEDNVPWSKAHTFFADMGGFAIRFVSEAAVERRSSPHSTHTTLPRPTPAYPEILEKQVSDPQDPADHPQSRVQITDYSSPLQLRINQWSADSTPPGGPPDDGLLSGNAVQANSIQAVQRPDKATKTSELRSPCLTWAGGSAEECGMSRTGEDIASASGLQ